MTIPKQVVQASKAAQARVDKRNRQAEKARREAIRAKLDPFIASLAATLKSKGEARYEIPEGQWKHTGANCIATGEAAELQAECSKLGLKTSVQYHGETIEYRRYESAYLIIKP